MTTVSVKGKRGFSVVNPYPGAVAHNISMGRFQNPPKVNGFKCDANRVRVGKTRSDKASGSWGARFMNRATRCDNPASIQKWNKK